jgi:hypothetical protein
MHNFTYFNLLIFIKKIMPLGPAARASDAYSAVRNSSPAEAPFRRRETGRMQRHRTCT